MMHSVEQVNFQKKKKKGKEKIKSLFLIKLVYAEMVLTT